MAFAAIGMPGVAADEPLSSDELEPFLPEGRGHVAVGPDDVPAGYVPTSVIDGRTHINQVSVSPAVRGRGVGARLIVFVASAGVRQARVGATLTTFRDVPCNAPYYRRLGFEDLQEAQLGPELAALVERERLSIPSSEPRVAMRRTVEGAAP